MLPVILNRSDRNGPVEVRIQADYDQGAFLSIEVKDRETGSVLLDIAIENEVDISNLIDELSTQYRKFLVLRG